MGRRQTTNFQKLIQHSMRTKRSLFPFLYTCVMHLDPRPALIEECRKFVKLAEFFGSPQAPKLEVKTVHLLFMLDFLTGLVLRRLYLVHVLVVRADRGKTHDQLDEEFKAFKDELRTRGEFTEKGKNRIYKPRRESARNTANGAHDPRPTLIGFDELQNSELLQGSSLLKSMEEGKGSYETSEEVTALMNSSFLVNTLEALKKRKRGEGAKEVPENAEFGDGKGKTK